MKKLFIEMRRKFDKGDLDLFELDKIPEEKISIGAVIQYLDLIPVVRSYLEKKGKKVSVRKGMNYDGHILGCNSSAFDIFAGGFLLLADGKFHAINNAIQIQKEIYVFNGKNLEKISKKEIQENNKKTLAKKKKFLSADFVGLILSNKEGQKNNLINEVKKKIEKLGKRVYIFECDGVDMGELENFPDVEIWVNSACFGLARDDKRVVNLVDVLEFLD